MGGQEVDYYCVIDQLVFWEWEVIVFFDFGQIFQGCFYEEGFGEEDLELNLGDGCLEVILDYFLDVFVDLSQGFGENQEDGQGEQDDGQFQRGEWFQE